MFMLFLSVFTFPFSGGCGSVGVTQIRKPTTFWNGDEIGIGFAWGT